MAFINHKSNTRNSRLLSGAIRLLLLFLVVLSAAPFTACERDMEKIKEVTTIDELPAESMKGSRLIYSDSGIVRFVLEAPIINRFYDEEMPYIDCPDGAYLQSFDSTGTKDSELECNQAVFYEKERKLDARNDVKVTNAEGSKLESEHLVFNGAKQKITSDEFVKISTEDEIIFGTGLEANQDFTQYTIKNIKGIIQVKEEAEVAEE